MATKKTKKTKSSNDELEMKIFDLELEISKIKRDRSVIVLNKSMFLYFLCIGIALLGLFNGNLGFFNVLILMGLCVIIIGAYPYIKTMYKEERRLVDLISDLKGRLK